MIRDHDKSEKKDIRVICLKPFHVDGARSAALWIITAYCNETGPSLGCWLDDLNCFISSSEYFLLCMILNDFHAQLDLNCCMPSVWVRYVLHVGHVCGTSKGTSGTARTEHVTVHFYCPRDGLFCVISLTWPEWWGLGCHTGHSDGLLTCIRIISQSEAREAGGWPMRGENTRDTRGSLTTRWVIKHQDHHRSSCAQPPGLVTSWLGHPWPIRGR